MAKISSGASSFGFLPFFGQAPASRVPLALPPRPIAGTIVSAFFMVGIAAWALALANQAVAQRASAPENERAAFQPSQYVRAEFSAGYVGNTLLR
ncbi:MAG: hypothetical protein G01um101431_589 [Parcubacteria group bacterium Gr01-1014_31]|nr:MAG: hypothetical protein G01um101431_589 [Parcubacteria group bacterium Gr01-1014_31]